LQYNYNSKLLLQNLTGGYPGFGEPANSQQYREMKKLFLYGNQLKHNV